MIHNMVSRAGASGDETMSLLGGAALAMWWELTPGVRAEFEHWHSHEHWPERLGIPGFLRASRWTGADGGDTVFVMYELEDFGVLSSAHYLARLNAPTPWSTRMMPHHRDMVRSQCRVLASRGSAIARQVLTLRLSPAPQRDAALRDALTALIDAQFEQQGLTGLHLLQHQTPAIAQTAEQKLRGGDRVADWVLVVSGCDPLRLAALADGALSDASLVALGALPGRWAHTYALSHTATPADIA
jgi:hypothetical protein